MKDQKCDGWFGPRCRFEARYDKGQTTVTKAGGQYSAEDIERIINAATPKTYVCDVCVRCGHVIERRQS